MLRPKCWLQRDPTPTSRGWWVRWNAGGGWVPLLPQSEKMGSSAWFSLCTGQPLGQDSMPLVLALAGTGTRPWREGPRGLTILTGAGTG